MVAREISSAAPTRTAVPYTDSALHSGADDESTL